MNTFEEIKERAKLLHYKWGVYSKVCNRSPEITTIINEYGFNFFVESHRLTFNSVISTIMHFANNSRCSTAHGINLDRLIYIARNIGKETLASELSTDFVEFQKYCERFEEHSYDYTIDSSPLMGLTEHHDGDIEWSLTSPIKTYDIDEALEMIRRFINKYDMGINHKATFYEWFMQNQQGDSEKLTQALVSHHDMQSLLTPSYFESMGVSKDLASKLSLDIRTKANRAVSQFR
ncbi:hypothetical protein JCM19235_5120 [Vibrio maritimus]|uniref:Uncharacterized protein n=1 Tax=Vibrio maritimus TaxID=990268 RepID=A0A090RMW7_9VIBR|nr:hypothetical protein JCM19235_5120 [Vibrio maritimus]